MNLKREKCKWARYIAGMADNKLIDKKTYTLKMEN